MIIRIVKNAQVDPYGDNNQQSRGYLEICRGYFSVAMDLGLSENGAATISMDLKFNFPRDMAITRVFLS